MTSTYKAHLSILEALGFKYFQRCDSSTAFPTRYFDRLTEDNLLFHDVVNLESATEFTKIAQLIGTYSVAAGIIWAMHNQQWNTVCALAPEVAKRLRPLSPLIASVTSRYRGSTADKLAPEDSDFRLWREAPICSYRHQAALFLVSVPLRVDTKFEDWLVLLSAEHVEKIGATNVLSAARSTLSGPIRIDSKVPSSTLLGPMSAVHSTVFVPLAHLGWMSVYTGGLSGVLDRLRVFMRDGNMSNRNEDRLFRSRIAKAVAHFYAAHSLIRDCNTLCFTGEAKRMVMLNVVKTQVSELISEAVEVLTQALGMNFALALDDPLGLELFRRDSAAASLMVHNDLFYDHIFDLWYTKVA